MRTHFARIANAAGFSYVSAKLRLYLRQCGMKETAEGTVSQLQGVLKELSQSHDDERLSQLAEQALHLLEELPALDRGQREQRSTAMQLHTAGIGLWNRSVALKSAGAITLSLNAQMRHIACNLVLMANPLEPSEHVFLKQITMATKTGRAWLDCENPTMAETSLALASECWEKLTGGFPAAAKDAANRKAYFRVLCFRIEAAVGLEQHETAFEIMQQAKELLHSLESEVGYLAMLCYNFGLDIFQKGEYQQSVAWLKESYDIGRGCPAVGAVKQARTLRLLANAFLEWDGENCWQKALNAIGLANSEHSHPAGLLLKTSILLQHDSGNERLNATFESTLHHPDLTLDMALATIRLAAQHGRADLAFSGVQLLTKRYQNVPDLSRVSLLQLELLLEHGQTSDAKQLVEDCITAHNTGTPLDVKTRKHFHLLLWEQAGRSYEASEHGEALQWYNYSLSLFPAQGEPDKNIAKLQRNRCSCLIHLKEYDRATEAVEEAKRHDPECPHTHYLAFKLALLQDQEEQAVQSLGAMGGCSEGCEDVPGLVCLAAQMAFEKSHRGLAVLSLEQLVGRSSSTQQVFTALRCLVRLKLTFLGSEQAEKIGILHTLLSYLHQAQERLGDLPSVSAREGEATWFLKVAWNLALQCGEHYHEMAQFFSACHQLSSCVQPDSSVLLRQKTCQLMAAAAGVQVARSAKQEEEKTSAFETVLEHVSECRAICQRLGRAPAPSDSSSDPTPSLLSLYEFEARLHLGHPNLETVIEDVSKVPGTEPKTFETIAALAIRGPSGPRGHALGMRTLKLAIQHHLQAPQLDCERLSKCYHSLVQLSMGSEGSGGDMASKEQAWAVLSEVLDLLDTTAKESFPEMEILWFLAKAWNCGIHLFSSLRFKEAEQWCSMGMRFLKNLSQLKQSYEGQMTSVYAEVLSRVQSHPMHTL